MVGHCQQVFKTITLGSLTNDKAILRTLVDHGCHVSSWAKELLGSSAFVRSSKKMAIELATISLADLGLDGRALLSDIYRRAGDCGLGMCPPEVGPQLRLEYKDQPLDHGLVVGMEPIMNAIGVSGLFVVEHVSTGLWLSATSGIPSSSWYGRHRKWLFQAQETPSAAS